MQVLDLPHEAEVISRHANITDGLLIYCYYYAIDIILQQLFAFRIREGHVLIDGAAVECVSSE